MLRFHARPERVVYVPGRRLVGSVPQYVGRQFVPSTDNTHAGAHVPSEDPFAIDEAHADIETRRAARHLMQKCRDGDLLAADEATARACGVEFVPLVKTEDGWAAKPKPAAKHSAKE